MVKEQLIMPERMYEFFYPDFQRRFPELIGKSGKKYVVEDIIEDCKDAIDSIDHLLLFLQSPLLLKAVIDQGINRQEDWNALKSDVSSIVYSIFEGDYPAAYDGLSNDFPSDFLGATVRDGTDKMSWHATNPAFIDHIVSTMQDDLYDPDVIVSIGHGSYRSAYMLATVTDREIVPLRFSRHKYDDPEPVLFIGEEYCLSENLRDKKILCFDEDSQKGVGVKQAAEFLKRFNPKDIKTAVSFIFLNNSVDYYGADITYNTCNVKNHQ
jgi:hypoxanthine phosphoribosyltransferase